MNGTTGGSAVGTGGTNSATGGSGVGVGGSNVGQAGSGPQVVSCQPTDPRVIRAPMRRLTRQEYNNTVRDVLKDTSFPANGLPPEELGNGFGNDADAQDVFSSLIEEYANVAEKIATTATSSANIGKLADCATQAKDATSQTACAKTIAESLAPKLWRRPLAAGESDGLVALYTSVRQANDFASGVGAMLEAMLQSPEYLYKPEFGVPIAGRTDVTRPSDYEMATRLASLFWASVPDDELRTAAAMGQLSTPDAILTQAKRLLADPKAKDVTKFFFGKLLPIESLAGLERDAAQYPTFSTKIGSLMRTEVETFLDNEIFSPDGSGTWPGVLTAKYTYVNKDLAAFYGIQGVTSDTFVKVPLDPATTHRGGLLTQAGILAGPIHTNSPNPVVRGSFIVQKLLCQTIPKPTGQIAAMVTLPDPKSAATARQRYSTHSTNPVCHACHVNMDPYGFALENFDPVGLWRDQEGGVTIDASGDSPQLGKFNGVLELEQAMAASEQAQNCFATHWTNFGYGRTISQAEACAVESVRTKFKESGYNIQQLLLALTQSEAFLNLPAVRE